MLISPDKTENKRAERYLRRKVESIASKARTVIRIDSRKDGKTSHLKEKYMTTPRKMFESLFVRLSVASLYRRYRTVRMRTIKDCIEIVKIGKSRDANVNALQEELINLSNAHTVSKTEKRNETK